MMSVRTSDHGRACVHQRYQQVTSVRGESFPSFIMLAGIDKQAMAMKTCLWRRICPALQLEGSHGAGS